MIPGFASAQRAWENKNPHDNECRCLEDDLFICPDCGHCDETTEMDCPECDGVIVKASDETRIEEYPSSSCPLHGWDPDDEDDR